MFVTTSAAFRLWCKKKAPPNLSAARKKLLSAVICITSRIPISSTEITFSMV